MTTAQLVATLALFAAFAAALVLAAVFDRRRGREIEHDPSRVPPGLRARLRHREHEED